MQKESVPQETAVTYGGQRKLFYAVDERGDYCSVNSSGWNVETEATLAAVAAIAQQRDDAWRRAQAGTTSPLEYHMYQRRMDIATLAQTTGLWQWRIRRHFQPARFAALPQRILRRYAQALDLPAAALQSLPAQPDA
jgi:hypothetical protein